MDGRISNLAGRVKRFSHTPTYRSAMLYLGFVVIATLLWCFVSFNRDVSLKDIPIAIKVVNVPPGYHFIDKVPDTVMCGFKGQGVKLLTRFTRSVPTLEIDFNKFDNKVDHCLRVPSLKNLLADMLSDDGITVIEMPILSIEARYADASKRVVVLIDVHNDTGLDINDEIVLQPDSVLVYGQQAVLDRISAVTVSPQLEEGVTAYDVPVALGDLPVISEPTMVHVEVSFIKTVTTTETVVLSAVNVPENLNITLLPGRMNVNYTTTRERRNERLDTIFVDYEAIKRTHSPRVAVREVMLPPMNQVADMAFELDSIDVITERVQ